MRSLESFTLRDCLVFDSLVKDADEVLGVSIRLIGYHLVAFLFVLLFFSGSLEMGNCYLKQKKIIIKYIIDYWIRFHYLTLKK